MHGNRLPTQRASAEVERVVPCAVALAEAAQRVGNVTPAQPPDICASGEEYGIVFEEADPPLCAGYYYFSSWSTSAKALTANSKSSRECAAETCVRTRAVPCGTTG